MNKKWTISLIGGIFILLVGVLVFMGQRGCEHNINNLIEEQLQDNEDDKEGQIPGKPLIVSVVENKSDIVAEVLNIEKGDFPQTLITLQILESKNINGFHNLLNTGKTIKASPQYIYEFTSGTQRIIFTHPQNLQNFVAYYLLPKDRISAIAKAKGGNGNIVWSVTDIKRIAEQELELVPELSPIPVSVVPNKSVIIAKVLKIERKDFPKVDITLKIIESIDVGDFSNLLEPGMTIIASPRYIYEKGTFVFSEPQNVKDLLAYYLLPGDIIKTKATLKEAEGNTIWAISDLERLNQM